MNNDIFDKIFGNDNEPDLKEFKEKLRKIKEDIKYHFISSQGTEYTDENGATVLVMKQTKPLNSENEITWEFYFVEDNETYKYIEKVEF